MNAWSYGLVLLLACVACSPSAAASNDSLSGEVEDVRQALAIHNQERAAYGIAPLLWSETLATEAESWARTLAQQGKLEHSNALEGENLAMGSAHSTASLVGLWTSEKRYFVEGVPFSDAISTTGKWYDVGHYTQIIWASTTELGCGTADRAGATYLVCRYSPPGNVWGQLPY